MQGDQLARQWRIIRVIEASPNGLTVAEIAKLSLTLEALQVQHHAKAQRAPSGTFGTLRSSFSIFSAPLLRLIEKQEKKNFFHPLRLSVSKRKAGYLFGKKTDLGLKDGGQALCQK
jgi:hypothetical protein